MQETIRPEDLWALREAQLQAKFALAQAELIQSKIFHKYRFEEGDQFNTESGIITRKSAPAPVVESPKQD